ncbi:MAG: 4-(cytidine 5'-diphospho)-2-C-methyl-D-erythritol kinase [Helicobacteraceae bacterium]|jgi:4-diphosphocytidyl-2-C-methyl-D-erythritol kinase|nr:4-(cytidine 5'-diphospho)-2-C-methyl-D-erythritol kinase [Helicobacteraceae bacterium]
MPPKIYDARAKLNVFLKLIGRRADGYHLIASRFVIYDRLSDKMWFEKSAARGFEVVGDFNCALENNAIYRAYATLSRAYPSKALFSFANAHKVVVYKNIPSGAGLGGASSDAATFLIMINEAANLKLSNEELSRVGAEVGADVPFFLSGYESANVGGAGEQIEPFSEKPPRFELKTAPILCETPKVYLTFRRHFSDKMADSAKTAPDLLTMKAVDILREFDPETLNDLLEPALKRYPELREYKEDGWFLSGSGGTFFRIEEQ